MANKQSKVDSLEERISKLVINISDNTSNSDVCQELSSQYSASSVCTESKSLEGKEIDEFVDSIYEEQVSKEIIQRIREKKLREQELSSISVEELCSEKVRPKVPLEQNSKSVPIQPEETKVSHDYIVAQDFIQEVSSGFTDEETIEVVDVLTTNTTIEVELAHLFLKVSIEGKSTIQAKQKEISCRYSYGKRFEMGVQELMVKENISEQTARKRLFQDIIKHLSGLTLETLRKRTQRSIKLYKLIEKIRVDKIKNIKTFSADSISKFTQPQIQIILDYFNEGEKVRPKVPLEQNGVVNHVSNTDSINIISRADITKKTSPIAQASAPPIFEPEVDVSISPVSINSKTKISVGSTSKTGKKALSKKTLSEKQNNSAYTRGYFRSKLLEQYPDLYKECSSENVDYYGINAESLCPICKLIHEDEEGIEAEYKDGSYYIKCEASEIGTVISARTEQIV
ncbi:19151_t:CDS:1 [Cetraspora pellucida]|uniref:19151_t:CDS:1 n=1 Tax=Cetraspora pellucida TaxID=1433469 RepID=A0A9N9DXT4_9GLOM|nr:19151_t:CDS:1 [Cetraspora pellucida]